jgi:hypothetical protein
MIWLHEKCAVGAPEFRSNLMNVIIKHRDKAAFRAAREKWQVTLAEQRRSCMNAEGDEYVEAVSNYLYLLSSEQRAPGMVSMLQRAWPESFWKVFVTHWPNCDDTWVCEDRLLGLLRKAAGEASAIPYYSNEQRAFFESLPEIVTIYRGCSRHRVGGISWTTDISIAKQFAHGHRQIRVPEPVIGKHPVKTAYRSLSAQAA